MDNFRVVKQSCIHLPNQVYYLLSMLPSLAFAEHIFTTNSYWRVRYVLLVWFSVMIHVPFPLYTLLPDEDIASEIDRARRALPDPSLI